MFGEKIRELRQSKNMTQSELGRALGVTSQSVSKWEQNTTSPDLLLLPRIARYFGISMDELFDFHPEESDTTCVNRGG